MPIYWRPLWRTFTGLLLVAVPVALFAGFILLTWFPDSAVVDEAGGLPLVGPLIGRLQDHYRSPPQAPADDPDEETDVTVHLVYHARKPRVVPGMGGARPAPVLPLSPRRPEPEVVERALEAFPTTPKLARLEPYLVYSDAAIEGVREACGALIGDAESLYRELYGVELVGEAAEAILLFERRQDYKRFASGEATRLSTGHAGGGFVATFVGGRRASDTCRTLLHEIAHLLNWRALGPALPPWLTEGLAVNFEQQARGERPPYRLLDNIASEGRLRPFEVLAGVGFDEFHAADDTESYYAASGLWVRYLSTDTSVGDEFGFFLDYLSRGGPWAKQLQPEDFLEVRTTPSLADDLLYFLGSDYERLDADFREWLRSRS